SESPHTFRIYRQVGNEVCSTNHIIMSYQPAIEGGANQESQSAGRMPKYPGVRVTSNGNQLVAQYVEACITEGGIFYPITPSTEGGEIYQQSYAQGELNVFGQQKIVVECEGEHAAQGGAP